MKSSRQSASKYEKTTQLRARRSSSLSKWIAERESSAVEVGPINASRLPVDFLRHEHHRHAARPLEPSACESNYQQCPSKQPARRYLQLEDYDQENEGCWKVLGERNWQTRKRRASRVPHGNGRSVNSVGCYHCYRTLRERPARICGPRSQSDRRAAG